MAEWGDEDAVFPWASVTKLATALAILVGVEEETVSLQDPVGPPGSTLAHLLAHASGLGPDGTVIAAPGTRRIYSNAGYQIAAAHLEARSVVPFGAYLREAVLEPLGMRSCVLDPSVGAASGLSGGLDDLLRLGGELLAPRQVLRRRTLRLATQVAFPGLDGVLPGFGEARPCNWGLGPEIRGSKWPHWTSASGSPRTFGHFGQAGGFLWVDPDAGVACGVLTDTPFGPWAQRCWPQLSDAVLGRWFGSQGVTNGGC